MDLLNKIDMMVDTTVAGDVATNTAKGKIDVIGGECPKGTVYDKIKKVCVPVKNESAGSPKPGDRFLYKGKKLTVKYVGSGLTHDTYIDVQFDNEKHPRSISMKNFFKGNDFKYIKESSVVGGSYIDGTTVNIIGSGQTRAVGRKYDEILDLARKERVEKEMDDPTDTNILGRKGLKFDKKSGAYVPSLWGDDE